MTFRYAWKRSIPVMAGYIVLGMGFGMLLGAKGYGVLGDRHERVYLRRIDAVCGDRSDNGRCVPDLGGAYDTYGQCAAFILRDLHGGTVQRYEAV